MEKRLIKLHARDRNEYYKLLLPVKDAPLDYILPTHTAPSDVFLTMVLSSYMKDLRASFLDSLSQRNGIFISSKKVLMTKTRFFATILSYSTMGKNDTRTDWILGVGEPSNKTLLQNLNDLGTAVSSSLSMFYTSIAISIETSTAYPMSLAKPVRYDR